MQAAERGRDPMTRHDSNSLRPKKTAMWGDDHKAVHYQRRILPRGRRGRGARRWSTRSKTTRIRISSPQIIGQARRSRTELCDEQCRGRGGRVNDGGTWKGPDDSARPLNKSAIGVPESTGNVIRLGAMHHRIAPSRKSLAESGLLPGSKSQSGKL